MIYSDEYEVTERAFNDKNVEEGYFEKRFIISFLSHIPLQDLKRIVELQILHPKSEKEWQTAFLLSEKEGLELKKLYEEQLVKFKVKIEITDED